MCFHESTSCRPTSWPPRKFFVFLTAAGRWAATFLMLFSCSENPGWILIIWIEKCRFEIKRSCTTDCFCAAPGWISIAWLRIWSRLFILKRNWTGYSCSRILFGRQSDAPLTFAYNPSDGSQSVDSLNNWERILVSLGRKRIRRRSIELCRTGPSLIWRAMPRQTPLR